MSVEEEQEFDQEYEEEYEEVEVTEFRVSPEFLDIMLLAVDILEKLANGEISITEARAIYQEKIAPIVRVEREKAVKSRSKRSSKSRKTSKKGKASKQKKSRGGKKKGKAKQEEVEES
ncbi:MAG: hypothetical protein LRS48_03185 [Desulfurococcales archaeon]|nr:hypothetical protein [Desulfurococcales archaeon]